MPSERIGSLRLQWAAWNAQETWIFTAFAHWAPFWFVPQTVEMESPSAEAWSCDFSIARWHSYRA
jgi:hypothetical protein